MLLGDEARIKRTCSGPIVGDEAGHVRGLAVNRQVPHTAHKVSVLHREIIREVGNPTQKQWAGEVQGPVGVRAMK